MPNVTSTVVFLKEHKCFENTVHISKNVLLTSLTFGQNIIKFKFVIETYLIEVGIYKNRNVF